MNKIKAIIMVGMFVVVGCGSIVMAEDDDPVFPNRPPKAPVLIEEQSQMEKDCYTYVFYAVDPDGDQVYYDIAWNRIGEPKIITCSPDDPVVPWLGPFESGEELEKLCTFHKSGEYELTIRAKDTHDNIGPSTTITVTYKSATKEKEFISNETSYDLGFVILETFSTSGSISGLPVSEHVGSLHDVEITTNGGSISLFFTIPVWGSAINYKNNDVHIQMEHFLGVTTAYTNGEGCLVGICKNISWELLY